jgi:hypothetical protein
MFSPKFFPTVMIVLDVAAAVGYAVGSEGDCRKVIYWLSAAVLTTVVTW